MQVPLLQTTRGGQRKLQNADAKPKGRTTSAQKTWRFPRRKGNNTSIDNIRTRNSQAPTPPPPPSLAHCTTAATRHPYSSPAPVSEPLAGVWCFSGEAGAVGIWIGGPHVVSGPQRERLVELCEEWAADPSCKPAIAQLVEHLTVDCCSHQMVTGSIPVGRIF